MRFTIGVVKKVIRNVNDINELIMNLITNQIYSFFLNRRKEIITGITMYIGNKWVLLRYIPVDYVIDGYVLIKRKHIKDINRKEREIFKENVLRIKGLFNSSSN